MTTLAQRAQANAQRARSAQDARGVTRQEANAPEVAQAQPHRTHRWSVWKADDSVVDVCVYPAMTRGELREAFYPDAKSLLMAEEA